MTVARKLISMLIDTPFESIARNVYCRFDPSKGGQYERELIRVLHKCLDVHSNCIDIGAYRGSVLQEIIKCAPKGSHHAFEPVPEQSTYLKNKFPNVHVSEVALSNEQHQQTFNYVASRPTYSGLKRVQYPTNKEDVREIIVQTQTLDAVVPKETSIDFIKIDVEGAEYLVLCGAIETIRKNKPFIAFEHGLTSPWYYGIASEKIYDFLTSACSLRVSLMEDWLKGKQPLTRDAFAAEVAHARNYYFLAHR